MKAILNLRKSIFYVVVLSVSACMYSCSDDDDDNGKNPLKVTDVNGSYAGKMYVSDMEISTQSTGTPENPEFVVAAKFESNKTTFEKFPVDDFVKAIVGEEAAAEILEGMDPVPYVIEYESELNAAQDSIYLNLQPKALEFDLVVTEGEGEDETEVTKKVVVSIKAHQTIGSYSKKKVELPLISEEIKVEGVALDPYTAQYICIKLNKE